MIALSALRRQLIGFFVDDAFLGLATVLTVVAASLCRGLLSGRPLVAGALLLGGCLVALLLSVARAASSAAKAPVEGNS